ncbi:MAG: hypothetical protein LBM87_06165 [Ruminococcus sp.]|jgi:hypothetical protein|nr:hypothetical protein [Ruminococcus sp.]
MYIDPGTGSIIIQILIGGLAGISFLGYAFKAKIKSLFTKKKAEPAPELELETDNFKDMDDEI